MKTHFTSRMQHEKARLSASYASAQCSSIYDAVIKDLPSSSDSLLAGQQQQQPSSIEEALRNLLTPEEQCELQRCMEVFSSLDNHSSRSKDLTAAANASLVSRIRFRTQAEYHLLVCRKIPLQKEPCIDSLVDNVLERMKKRDDLLKSLHHLLNDLPRMRRHLLLLPHKHLALQDQFALVLAEGMILGRQTKRLQQKSDSSRKHMHLVDMFQMQMDEQVQMECLQRIESAKESLFADDFIALKAAVRCWPPAKSRRRLIVMATQIEDEFIFLCKQKQQLDSTGMKRKRDPEKQPSCA